MNGPLETAQYLLDNVYIAPGHTNTVRGFYGLYPYKKPLDFTFLSVASKGQFNADYSLLLFTL